MNPFIDALSYVTDDRHPTHAEAVELLDFICDLSSTDELRYDFARDNITQEDANAKALADPHFLEEYLDSNSIKHNDPALEVIADAIKDHPEYLAYHLATIRPELATQLFNELEYWRTQGRI